MRVALGLSLATVARAAGMSPAQLARLERAQVRRPTLEQLCRAGRALGLASSLRLFPSGSPVRDAAQLGVLDRFSGLLGPPLAMRREVGLPVHGDLRAWDGMLVGGSRTAFTEGEIP